MKKSFKKIGKTDSVKMYTWSPYTSNMFFSDPKMMSAAVSNMSQMSQMSHSPRDPAHEMGLQF